MKLRLINRKYIIKTNVKKKWTKWIGHLSAALWALTKLL